MSLLAQFSMRNRALIALVTIVAAVFGGLAITSLKQELIPSVEIPQISIVTVYQGASPDVVNTDVSTPIETAIQALRRGVDGLLLKPFEKSSELIEAANTPPLIRHALAHFVCRKVNDYRVGDHELFVGEVLRATTHDGQPLIFHNSKFVSLS